MPIGLIPPFIVDACIVAQRRRLMLCPPGIFCLGTSGYSNTGSGMWRGVSKALVSPLLSILSLQLVQHDT